MLHAMEGDANKLSAMLLHAGQHYDNLSRWGQEPSQADRYRVEQTLELIPADAHTILDLGCGDGTASNPLVGRGSDLVGIDISPVALRHFRGKAVVASTDYLPLPDKSFDLVLCAETLEHLPTGPFEETLNEIERVAGRYIIVTTPNEEYLPARFTRCEQCGVTYHTDLHTRSMDRASHMNLFRKFSLLKTIGILHWRHSPFLTYLEHHLLGVYSFKEGLLCPHCGHINRNRPRMPLWKKALLVGLRRAYRVLPMGAKALWIASLYRRNESRAEPCC